MKKSYVFNTLICCGCTALIFLLHFIVYGGVLLNKSGADIGAALRCLDRIRPPGAFRRAGAEEPWFPPNRYASFGCGSCYTAVSS